MPFKKVNVKDEINKRLENDAELKKAYDCAQLEYEVLKQLVKMRKEMGFSQSDVAKSTMKAMKIVIFTIPAMSLAMNITILAVVWFGGKQIIAGSMTPVSLPHL